jgi:hypothetical protein
VKAGSAKAGSPHLRRNRDLDRFNVPKRERFRFRKTARRRWFSAPALFALLTLLLPAVLGAQPQTVHTEAELKAAALLSFPKYVDWPLDAFENTNSPIVIAVFGSDPVAAEMDKAIDKSFEGHPIEFRRITTAHDCDGRYHILFIGPDRRRIPDILERASHGTVLTIGEASEFLERGGIIQMTWRDSTIHFQVNLTAARQARLQISSKLLNLAEVVKGKQG